MWSGHRRLFVLALVSIGVRVLCGAGRHLFKVKDGYWCPNSPLLSSFMVAVCTFVLDHGASPFAHVPRQMRDWRSQALFSRTPTSLKDPLLAPSCVSWFYFRKSSTSQLSLGQADGNLRSSSAPLFLWAWSSTAGAVCSFHLAPRDENRRKYSFRLPHAVLNSFVLIFPIAAIACNVVALPIGISIRANRAQKLAIHTGTSLNGLPLVGG